MGKNRKPNAPPARGSVADRSASTDVAPSPPAPIRQPLSGRKKLLFAAICLLVLPCTALIVTELLLVAAGYGYSPSFFIERRIEGREVLTDNPKFGWRFFPPTIARRPHDFVIPAEKPDNTFRIFLFGESAAWGDPDPSFSMSRILQKLLADQFPGLEFEVVNSAMAAISSHVVYQIAKEAADREPDAFIVYMGNNEVIGPFGPGTVFSGFSNDISLIRTALWLKGRALVQVLGNLQTALQGRENQPQAWAGMQMFERNKIRSDDARLKPMYGHFRRNLTDIIRLGRSGGAGVIVCNVAANFGEWGPHASLHRSGMKPQESAAWTAAFDNGCRAMESGQWDNALASFSEALTIDPTYAELQFRTGRCYEKSGRFQKAKEHYALAVDEDCLRFRTDSSETTIIRECAQSEMARFVDVREIFNGSSPNGIPGLNLTDDHVHMNFRGNYLIASAVLPEVIALVKEKRKAVPRNPGSPLSQAECAARLAYTGYNRLRIAERNLQRVTNPPFTAQPDHAEHLTHFTRIASELSTFSLPAGLRESAQEYEQAISREPDDWVLHENMADLYQRAKDSKRETAALRRVLELVPHHLERNAWLGQSLLNQGLLTEAEDCYRKALQFDPTNVKAYSGLGAALMRQGKTDEGLKQFENAVAARPGVAEGHNALGEAYYRSNRLSDAENAFAQAVRLDTGYALAHTNLGVLQISKGAPESAIPHLRKALEIRADFPDALKHLASIYVKSDRLKEAVKVYSHALETTTDSAELRSGLGSVYAQGGDVEQAVEQLKQAVSLRPDVIPLRKSFGKLLLQSGRKREAAVEFRRIEKYGHPEAETERILNALEREGY